MNKNANRISRVAAAAVAIAFIAGASPALSTAPAIDPSAYPEIGDKEMGQLRWMLEIADQDVDDFEYLVGSGQAGMEAYRYQLAFMTYFLAIEQYHKLSACPEIIRPRMDRLIEKMIQKPVWEFWAEVSQGVPAYEPLMNKPYPEQHDPVGDINIMYSGHLGHMIGLYETLYRDLKWDAPGAIVFEWDEDEKYTYDNHSLNVVMHEQMRDNPWHMIACEPNTCFPECNQHPALSFILYDHVHKTGLAEVNELFMESFVEKHMIDPKTHEAAAFYLVKQDLTLAQRSPRLGNALDLVLVPVLGLGIVTADSSSANGWTGAFMHAWQPDYIERHYPHQRDHHVRPSGDFAKLKSGGAELIAPGLNYGFFATLAAEVGDTETRDMLVKQADQMYGGTWEEGFYRYPADKKTKANVLTGKLVAMARANLPDGMLLLHQKPFDDHHFKQPKITGVDFPNVLVHRAVYDSKRDALILTVAPGNGGGQTTFKAVQLNPGKSYTLYIDGVEKGSYSGVSEVAIKVLLDGKREVILAAK